MKDATFNIFEGNQLIYVPKIRWGTTIQLNQGKWNTSLALTTFGDRFVGFDNIEKVEGFHKFDFSIYYSPNSDYTFALDIDNIFNEDYERVAYYGMPLRNFTLSFKSNI
jgi:outer membrane receptor protein involved in Fe transport